MAWLRWVMLLCAAACARSPRQSLPAPERGALVLESSSEGFVGGAAVWQGFSHTWGYNHRINRIGSILEQSEGGCPQVGGDSLCEVRWTNTGASGTGPDSATVRTWLALVAAPRIGFGAASGELLLSGAEGASLSADGVIDVALDDYPAGRSQFVALFNGFDLLALDSADKLIRFGVHVGEVEVDGGVAHVPVRVEGAFACSSAECPPRDLVDYSVRVSALVVAYDPGDLRVDAHPLGVSYA